MSLRSCEFVTIRDHTDSVLLKLWPYAKYPLLTRDGAVDKGTGDRPSEAWLAARQGLLTGSDAPYMHGLGYDSIKRWRQKKLEWPATPVPQTVAMKRGLDAEPELIRRAEDALGRPEGFLRHETRLFWHGLLGASPDAWNEQFLVECKTTGSGFDPKKWDRWVVQVQHQVLVLRARGCRLRAYISAFCGSEYAFQEITTSDGWTEEHLRICRSKLEDLGYELLPVP